MVTATNLGPRVEVYYQVRPTRFAEFRMWRKAHDAWVVLHTDGDGITSVMSDPCPSEGEATFTLNRVRNHMIARGVLHVR